MSEFQDGYQEYCTSSFLGSGGSYSTPLLTTCFCEAISISASQASAIGSSSRLTIKGPPEVTWLLSGTPLKGSFPLFLGITGIVSLNSSIDSQFSSVSWTSILLLFFLVYCSGLPSPRYFFFLFLVSNFSSKGSVVGSFYWTTTSFSGCSSTTLFYSFLRLRHKQNRIRQQQHRSIAPTTPKIMGSNEGAEGAGRSNTQLPEDKVLPSHFVQVKLLPLTAHSLHPTPAAAAQGLHLPASITLPTLQLTQLALPPPLQVKQVGSQGGATVLIPSSQYPERGRHRSVVLFRYLLVVVLQEVQLPLPRHLLQSQLAQGRQALLLVAWQVPPKHQVQTLLLMTIMQMKLSSMRQNWLHPSPLTVFPSSHSSPANTRLSPHSGRQLLLPTVQPAAQVEQVREVLLQWQFRQRLILLQLAKQMSPVRMLSSRQLESQRVQAAELVQLRQPTRQGKQDERDAFWLMQQQLGSITQVGLHPSLPAVLLSSHYQPRTQIPSPQTEEQEDAFVRLQPGRQALQPVKLLHVLQFDMEGHAQGQVQPPAPSDTRPPLQLLQEEALLQILQLAMQGRQLPPLRQSPSQQPVQSDAVPAVQVLQLLKQGNATATLLSQYPPTGAHLPQAFNWRWSVPLSQVEQVPLERHFRQSQLTQAQQVIWALDQQQRLGQMSQHRSWETMQQGVVETLQYLNQNSRAVHSKEEGLLVEEAEMEVEGARVELNWREGVEEMFSQVSPQKVLYSCSREVLEAKGAPGLKVLKVTLMAGKGQLWLSSSLQPMRLYMTELSWMVEVAPEDCTTLNTLADGYDAVILMSKRQLASEEALKPESSVKDLMVPVVFIPVATPKLLAMGDITLKLLLP